MLVSVPPELVKASRAPPDSLTVPFLIEPPTKFHEPVAALSVSVHAAEVERPAQVHRPAGAVDGAQAGQR